MPRTIFSSRGPKIILIIMIVMAIYLTYYSYQLGVKES